MKIKNKLIENYYKEIKNKEYIISLIGGNRWNYNNKLTINAKTFGNVEDLNYWNTKPINYKIITVYKEKKWIWENNILPAYEYYEQNILKNNLQIFNTWEDNHNFTIGEFKCIINFLTDGLIVECFNFKKEYDLLELNYDEKTINFIGDFENQRLFNVGILQKIPNYIIRTIKEIQNDIINIRKLSSM